MNREIHLNTVEDQVYQILLNDIRTLKLPPGSRVNENKIAEDLQVSRSPVRDAIKRLKGDGLIATIPNKGAFVRKLTTHEMNEMYDARLMMELFGLHDLSIPLPAEDRKMLVSVLDRSEVAFESKKMDEYLASDFALHKSIVALRHNDYISGMYESLHWQLYVVLLESDWDYLEFQRIRNDHLAVITSLLEGNVEAARSHLTRHITLARQVIIARSAEECEIAI